MSIIQKLENSYVAILRVVVIVVATILLVVAAVMGAMALKGMLPASQKAFDMAAVDPKDVLAQVAPDARQATADAGQPDVEPAKANPYLADYEKALAAVGPFVSKTSRNTLEVNKARFFGVLDRNMAEFEADDIKAKYISGLAAAFATSLADPRLIARVEKPLAAKRAPVAAPAPAPVPVDGEEPVSAPVPAAPEPVVEESPYKESPLAIVEDVLKAYNKVFGHQLAEAGNKQAAAAAAHMEAKASATMRMYAAGGLFGTFLLVIFLTIAIRIERNLRDIAARA